MAEQTSQHLSEVIGCRLYPREFDLLENMEAAYIRKPSNSGKGTVVRDIIEFAFQPNMKGQLELYFYEKYGYPSKGDIESELISE